MEKNSLISIPFRATYYTASNRRLELRLLNALDDVTKYVAKYFRTDIPFITGHVLKSATLNMCTPSQTDHEFSYQKFKSVNTVRLTAHLGYILFDVQAALSTTLKI